MLALLSGCSAFLECSALRVGQLSPLRRSPHGPLMQTLPSSGGSELEASNELGNTFWATLDGRDEDGLSADGMLPPGDDLIEDELKRLFSIDPDEEGVGDSGFSDMDEFQLMYKLRKELGDADFNRIFDDPRIKGSDIGY